MYDNKYNIRQISHFIISYFIIAKNHSQGNKLFTQKKNAPLFGTFFNI